MLSSKLINLRILLFYFSFLYEILLPLLITTRDERKMIKDMPEALISYNNDLVGTFVSNSF